MANKIYKAILERKLDNFVEVFSNDSNSIFKNQKNKLIHPGEFGKYREEICKEILKLLLKTDFSVSDGFIITKNDRVSKQCDIVVYNSKLAPLISNDTAKMFPIEEVKMIGEVKSNLSRSDYIEALRKLALNKSLYEDRNSIQLRKKINSKTYDTFGTFLICNKFDFDFNELDYAAIYGDIPRKYWHNAILSIEDGFFVYALDFAEATQETINKLRSGGYISDKMKIIPYPLYHFENDIIETRENHVSIEIEDKFHHIINFFINISNCADEIWDYEHDPVEYLGLNGESSFKDDN